MAKRGQVRRFEKGIIVTHWLYAIAFIALVVTGIGFEYPSLSFLLGPTSRLIHRAAAVIMVVAPFAYFVVNPKASSKTLWEIFAWGKDDFLWLLKAPSHYMLGKGEMPPAGMYNAGQKLNYIIVVVTGAVFTASGLIMWFVRPDLSLAARDIFRWSAISHQVAFFVGTTMFCLHLYLSLIHPYTKPAITAMITGYVSRAYAKGHHPKWLEQIEAQGRVAGD